VVSLRRRINRLRTVRVDPGELVDAQQRWRSEGLIPADGRVASKMLKIQAFLLQAEKVTATGTTDYSEEEHDQVVSDLAEIIRVVEGGQRPDSDLLATTWRFCNARRQRGERVDQ